MSLESPKKMQVFAQVKPGLRAAVQAAAERDGLMISDVVRIAVMRYLGVDVNGAPVVPDPFTLLRDIELPPIAPAKPRKSTRGKAGQ